MSRPRLDFIKQTPRSSEFDDDYYSPEDGLAESSYVFIEGGDVINRMQALRAGETLTIAELGLGTALNLALILQAWSEHGPAGARCHVITVEKYPLSRSQLRTASARWTSLNQEFETILQRWPSSIPGCHRRSELIDGLTVDFWWEDVSDALDDLESYGNRWVDVWFLDGFTPSRNEAMWTADVLRAVAHLSRDAAHAATFTASGEVRRSLERVGFKVLKRPGFGRKRECLHGVLDLSQTSNEDQSTPVRPTAWDQPARTEKPQSCLVLGAGLAGSHIARRLAERNCNVTVLERGTIGSGGSTQPQGVIYTRPSHKHGKLADFSLTAYEFSVDHHQRKFCEGSLEEGIDGALSGYLQLSSDDVLERLATAFDDEDSPLKVVTREVASSIAGIALTQGAQHYPSSGWLHPRAICAELLDHPNITVIEGLGDTVLRQGNDDQWFAIAATGDCVATGDTAVVTTAWEAVADVRLDWLPLQPIRGQTTLLPSQGALKDLRCTVCHAGYTPPAKGNEHCIGATYGLNETSTEEREADHETNIHQLLSNVPALHYAIGSESRTGQAAVRCATADYLPIAGAVPNETEFMTAYDQLRHDRKRLINRKQPNIKGLY
ncbi:MAG: FAD-dependent 5-carboxymethylaminomethyl-2-thiouridine(34) oxidoreductase MnmC, partial [Pseudomonadota bacterium]|nr:FAD-dependent 5-carboxymethylaminomethyl-2-thiouridine(34) oxidoreductase MnmC [Pseudomonadota bacterium]